MTYYSEMSLDARLSASRKAINNALGNPALAARIAMRSYTAEKMNHGKDLLHKATADYDLQTREYGEAYEAQDSFTKQWEYSVNAYADFRGIARVVCKDNRKWYAFIGLPGALKRPRGEAINQIRSTYNNVLSSDEILLAMEPYGYPQSTVLEMKMAIEALDSLKMIRDKEETEAQDATRNRDASMEDLDQWMADFLIIARIAVKGQPELMELLGDVVYSAQ